MNDTIIITPEVTIGTNLLPLKNAKNSGNFTSENLLYKPPAIIPQSIPINWLLILAKPGATSAPLCFES